MTCTYTTQFGLTKKAAQFLNGISTSDVKMKNFLKDVFNGNMMMSKTDFFETVGEVFIAKFGSRQGVGDVWDVLGGFNCINSNRLVDFWQEVGEKMIVRRF